MNPEIFKGLLLTPGDKIRFTSKSIAISQLETAVISISKKGFAIKVIITPILSNFRSDGILRDNDIEEIIVVEHADEAVWNRTDKRFRKGQHVVTAVCEIMHEGIVIAAHDGMMVMRNTDGEDIVGSAYEFGLIGK